MQQKLVPLFLLVLVVVGSFFRVFEWDKKSLWQDELYTVASAVGVPLFETTIDADNEVETWGSAFDPEIPVKPIDYILKLEPLRSSGNFWDGIKHNIQAPLYPLLIRAKSQLSGSNPVNNRLISIFFSILILPIAFIFGRTLRDDQTGLIITAITSLSGFLIIYSQTARLYSMLFFILMLFLTFALKLHQNNIEKQKNNSWQLWTGFAVTALLGLYTHYFFALPVIFTGIIMTLVNRRDSEFLKQLWQTAGFVIMGFIPGALLFQSQVSFMSALGDETLSGTHLSLSLIERLWNTLTSLITPKNILLQILSSFFLFGVLIHDGFKKNWKSPAMIAAAGILFFIGILLIVDIANNTHRISTKRYFIFVAPFVYVIFAEGIRTLFQSKHHQTVKTIAGILLILAFGWNAWTVSNGDRFLRKEDYRSAGSLISNQYQEGDLALVSHSAVHSVGMAYYLPSDIDMLGINRRSWDKTVLDEKLYNLAKDRKRVWITFTHVPGDLKNTLRDWFKTHGWLSEEGKFSSVQVYLWTPAEAFP